LELGLDVVIGANIGEFKTNMKAVGTDVDAIQKALKTSFTGLNKLAKEYPGYFEQALKYAKEFDKYLSKVANQKGPVTLKQQATISAASNKYAGLVTGAPARVSKEELAAKRALEKQTLAQQKATEKLAREEARRAAAEARAAEKQHGNIVRARYALYDVANEGRRVGLIMVGLGLAAAKAGGDFEKAFKDVERTTGLTGTALENMRQSLVEISQTTPISFKDVTTVATLGAQMGIAAGGVDEFASTVSKFSAVTGVSVDTASMSFGRIAQLLKVSSSEYENLASSVLYAGRNSIATEAQILTLTSQIAASANQAGFAADETIGLATALASLGIQPEQARGVILRLFADFDKAISEGGQTLNDYGALMGMTAEQIKGLWDSNPAQFFTGFTDALGKASTTAEGMNGILSSLGIVETREVNVLQRLAGNQDLVRQSMENAGAAYASNTDLSTQFGIKTDNLNDKLLQLANNLLALNAAIGQGLGVVLKPIIDLFSSLLKTITSNPIAITIATISTVLATGVGIFLLYKAAVAQAMATMFAMSTTMKELAAEGIATTISLSGLRAVMVQLGVSGGLAGAGINKATFSITGLRAASAGAVSMFTKFIPLMAVIGAGMAITAVETKRANDRLKEMAQELYNVGRAGKSLDEVDFFNPKSGQIIDPSKLDGLSDFQTQLKATGSFANTASDALFGLFGMGEITTLGTAKKDISGVDTALTTLVSNGKVAEAKKLFEQLAEQADKVGVSQQQLSSEFLPNYTAAIQGAIPVTNDLADSELAASAAGENLADIIKTRLTESMIGGTAQQSKFLESVMDFSEGLVKSKGSISAWSSSGRKALSSFGTLLENIAAISGNDMGVAIQITAAAIRQIELAGGDASFQVQGLVSRINSMYGLNLNGSTVTSIAQLQALIASTGTITAATRAQINAMLSGGDFAGLMQQAFDSARKSINSAGSAVKKQIRTIKTYASEISGLFSEIYDRAFSLSESADAYAGGWQSITDRVNEAKDSVKELQAELDDMGADKNVLTYQLGVAEKYGDTLRATKIRAQLAKLEKDITKKTLEKTEAQEAATLSLEGNTQAARDNRDEIRNQVKDAGALIEAYASTAKANGKLPSKAEVASYAQTLATKFREQAAAIGFSGTEIEQYTKIIQGFGKAVKSVDLPNVKVSLDPVTTAVKAYLEEKKETKVNASLGNSSDFLTGIQTFLNNNPLNVLLKGKVDVSNIPTPKSEAPPAAQAPQQGVGDFGMKPYASATVRQSLQRYKDSLAASKITLANAMRAGNYGGVVSANNAIAAAESNIKRIEASYRFASGGYVSGPGTGNSDSIQARLSNGEYVIQAQAVNRYGVDFMNSLNQMRVGMPAAVAARGATQSSSVVYLSPEDRALLRAAADRPIALYTENTKIAQSANAGNVVLAQRGTN
jgi:TP901 family phage tail tape measure protein